MPKLSLTDVAIGDLVLAECAVIRYKTDGSPPHVWKEWKVGFQLRVLSVLYKRRAGALHPPVLFPDNIVGTF